MDLNSKLENIPSIEDGYNKLFSNTGNNEIVNIAMDVLRPFGFNDERLAGLHRFLPYPRENLELLADDIKENGIISPLIVRKNGLYHEILAGHNRFNAAKMAELKEVPCRVVEVDDNKAILIMTTTNLNQRHKLLPSEKAFAYKAQLDAQRRLNKDTYHTISQNSQDSRAQIARYVRLTYLNKPLLDKIDNNKISFMAGINLSYLKEEVQDRINNLIDKKQIKISLKETMKLKEKLESEIDCSDEKIIKTIESKTKSHNRQQTKLTLSQDKYYQYKSYFKKDSVKEIEIEIFKIVDDYIKRTNSNDNSDTTSSCELNISLE